MIEAVDSHAPIQIADCDKSYVAKPASEQANEA